MAPRWAHALVLTAQLLAAAAVIRASGQSAEPPRRRASRLECKDDPDGYVARKDNWADCAEFLAQLSQAGGDGCDFNFGARSSSYPDPTLAKEICPVTCDACGDSGHGEGIDHEHFRLVDYSPGTGNFLFRSGIIGNATSPVAYEELVQVMTEQAVASGITFPSEFHLDVVCLLVREWKEVENMTIDAEKEWFDNHPELGSFVHWPMYGISAQGYGALAGAVLMEEVCEEAGIDKSNCPSPQPAEFKAEVRDDLAETYNIWGDGTDMMVSRVDEVHDRLRTKYDVPRMIVFHCTCGCDRTGQFAGAYNMRYLNWTFTSALQYNNALINTGHSSGREHIIYQNQIAIQWYCYYLNAVDIKSIPDCGNCEGVGASVPFQCRPDVGGCRNTPGTECTAMAEQGCDDDAKRLCPVSCGSCRDTCDDDPDGLMAASGNQNADCSLLYGWGGCEADLCLQAGPGICEMYGVTPGTLIKQLCPKTCNACPEPTAGPLMATPPTAGPIADEFRIVSTTSDGSRSAPVIIFVVAAATLF